MPKSVTTIDKTEAPKRARNSAYAKQQEVYDEIVAPLKNAPDKAIRVEVDTAAGENQKGVSLALAYACKRAGFEGKSWYHGDDAVYVAKATDEEIKRREEQRAYHAKNSSRNGKSGTSPNTAQSDPGPEATKPAAPAARK